MEVGPEVRPTQPPHPQRIADAEDLELYGSPDTVNIDDILNVDVTPLSSISTSGPDTSVATSVKLGTSMAVDFDDRRREIQDTAAALLELTDSAAMAGARPLRNPSLAPNVGPTCWVIPPLAGSHLRRWDLSAWMMSFLARFHSRSYGVELVYLI